LSRRRHRATHAAEVLGPMTTGESASNAAQVGPEQPPATLPTRAFVEIATDRAVDARRANAMRRSRGTVSSACRRRDLDTTPAFEARLHNRARSRPSVVRRLRTRVALAVAARPFTDNALRKAAGLLPDRHRWSRVPAAGVRAYPHNSSACQPMPVDTHADHRASNISTRNADPDAAPLLPLTSVDVARVAAAAAPAPIAALGRAAVVCPSIGRRRVRTTIA